MISKYIKSNLVSFSPTERASNLVYLVEENTMLDVYSIVMSFYGLRVDRLTLFLVQFNMYDCEILISALGLKHIAFKVSVLPKAESFHFLTLCNIISKQKIV